MSSTIIHYTSLDSSAPQLTGAAGSLIAILDACLVNGYGSKSPAGWTKEYSGTNVASYRNPTTGGRNGVYLDVKDTNATYYTCRGYETMTAIDTGTEPFGVHANNSIGYKASARWQLFACNKYVYFFPGRAATFTPGTSNTSASGFMFGEFDTSIDFNKRNNFLIMSRTGTAFGTFVTGNVATGSLAATPRRYLHRNSQLNYVTNGAPWFARAPRAPVSPCMSASFGLRTAYDTSVVEAGFIEIMDGAQTTRRLGKLPGIAYSEASIASYSENEVVTLNGQEFQLVTVVGGTSALVEGSTFGGFLVQRTGTPL